MPQLEHIEVIEKRLWNAADTLLMVVQRTGRDKSSVCFVSTHILRDRGAGLTVASDTGCGTNGKAAECR